MLTIRFTGMMLLYVLVVSLLIMQVRPYTLNMNCTSEGLTGSACMNYMRNYINNYILVEKNYNRLTLPVARPFKGSTVPSEGDVYDTVDVRFLLTLKNLVSMDSTDGTMTVAAYIDLYWTDALLNWDPQWTDGYDFFNIDPTLIWFPDIRLYNSVGQFSDQISAPAVFLSSDGSALWDVTALLTFSCVFNTVMFPFDQQTCQAQFASWSYANYEVNITQAELAVTDTFSNIAWQVNDVSGDVTTVQLWQLYPYSFAVYTFQVGRYYNHYVSNAIVPSLLVTYLSLISLWIDDVSVRLSIGITALLALIAVQWTVSSEVPVSNHEPWLNKLSNVCICYTTFVCMEGYVVGYMRDQNKKAKRGHLISAWARGLIHLSEAVDRWSDYALSLMRAVVRAVLEYMPAVRSQQETSPSHREPSCRETTGSAVELTENPMSKDEHFAADSLEEAAEPVEGGVIAVSTCSSTGKGEQLTWSQASMALDHLCHISLPLSFTLIILVFFADAAYG